MVGAKYRFPRPKVIPYAPDQTEGGGVIMMDTKTVFRIYGKVPLNDIGETRQFERVIEVIHRCTMDALDYCIPVLHQRYWQMPQPNQEESKRWRGEFDIVLFANDRIFIYELKSGQTRICYGRTDARDWLVIRPRSKGHTSSWFLQASKQRYFLLQTFLEQCKSTMAIPEPCHF